MKKTILLLSILIIASFLRLYNLAPAHNSGAFLPPGLYPDEAMNGNNAQESIDTGDFKIFYPENFGREGLFINIQALSINKFGHHPWALRLPSAIFGILTVLGLYFFTKELFKNEILALLASFLLATSFWHINFSRIGFRAIMAPFFLTWGLYLLLLGFNKLKNGVNFQKATSLHIIGGLIYGLGFHSYIAYRATPILFILILYFYFQESKKGGWTKQFLHSFLHFFLFALIAFFPLGLYFLHNPHDFLGRTAGISIFNSQTPFKDLAFNILKTAGMFNVAGDFNWRHNIAGKPLLFWPVGIFFLIGAYFSLRKILKWRKWLSPESITWAWFLTAFLPVVISDEGLPHALRSILMVPPVFILSAIGGLKVYEIFKLKFKNRWLLVIGCWLFFSLLLFEAYYSYFITWGKNPNVKNAFAYNDYIISGYLNSLPKELPKYAVVKNVNGEIHRDTPISLQSVLFLTDTFTGAKRKEKNIFYLTEEQYKNLKPRNIFIIKL